ncbi:hypothetical protein H2202_002701 [Exophiala xenobiotica]|nr:hypothetical protein H2202_002701 [Exophiala xenobiotica]
MPTIQNRLQRGFAPPDVIKGLSTTFRIPQFYFDDMGWNANGFSGALESHDQEDGRKIHTYCTYSRYLSKRVTELEDSGSSKQNRTGAREPTAGEKKARDEEEFNKMEAEKWTDPDSESSAESLVHNGGLPGTKNVPQIEPKVGKHRESLPPIYDYDWDFMGFCTLWKGETSDESSTAGGIKKTFTNVLLCFDLSRGLKKNLMAAVKTARQSLVARSRDPFCLLNVANDVVVEHFHTTLWTFQKPIRNIEKTRLTGWDADPQGNTSKEHRDSQVKELVNRYAEMHELNRHVHHIAEVLQVASRTIESTIVTHNALDSNDITTGVSQSLQFQALFIGNLRCRADAFTDRMKNETRFGFFGMNFFTMDGDWNFATQLWIFFVITGPITFAGLLLFLFELNVVGWVRETIAGPAKKYFRERRKREATSDDKTSLRNDVPLPAQNKFLIPSADNTIPHADSLPV